MSRWGQLDAAADAAGAARRTLRPDLYAAVLGAASA
jgi:hypothetical protein